MTKQQAIPKPASLKHGTGSLWRLALALIAGVMAAQVSAQTPTASRSVRFQAFATVSVGKLNDGTNQLNAGTALGADLDFNLTRWIKPGLEFRVSALPGTAESIRTLGAGPRLMFAFGRFEPYVDYLPSSGTIHFNHPQDPDYTHDGSMVRQYGGGVDVLLNGPFSVRVDVQTQRWRLSTSATVKPFYPIVGTAGVVYRFGTRSHLSR